MARPHGYAYIRVVVRPIDERAASLDEPVQNPVRRRTIGRGPEARIAPTAKALTVRAVVRSDPIVVVAHAYKRPPSRALKVKRSSGRRAGTSLGLTHYENHAHRSTGQAHRRRISGEV